MGGPQSFSANRYSPVYDDLSRGTVAEDEQSSPPMKQFIGKHSVNSVKLLLKDNTERSLVGNNLERVTTRGSLSNGDKPHLTLSDHVQERRGTFKVQDIV